MPVTHNAVEFKSIPMLIFGKVLQGGLGEGTLTDWLLEHNITELVTIELDQGVIDDFDNPYDNHTIIKGDFKEYYEEHKDEFDFIVQDIDEPTKMRTWLKTAGWNISRRG